METFKKIAIHLLRTLLAAVFIYSSVTKVISVDSFELYVYQHSPFSMLISALSVRALIGFEFLIGLLLTANLFTRGVLRAVIGILIAFSGFLAYQLFIGHKVDNCHCFGEIMPLDATESLMKNGVMIGVAVLLLVTLLPSWKLRFRKPLFYALCVLAVALPNMLFPPDLFFKDKFSSNEHVGQRFAVEKIKPLALSSGKHIDFSKGKKIVCMYSLRCVYCKMSARKTSAIYAKLEPKPEIAYFFSGDPQYLDSFWKESGSDTLPHQLIDPLVFYQLAGSELPMLYFLQDGIIVKQMHYSDAFDEDFIEFLNADAGPSEKVKPVDVKMPAKP